MNADVAVLLGQGVEVLPEKNVLGSDVGKDQVDLGLVAGSTSTNNGSDNLKHGGDARASSNHTKVANHVRGVDESTLGATDANGLANLEGGHVL